MASASGSKRGRPSKGPRVPFMVRLRPLVAAAYDDEWRDFGYETRQDYLAAVLELARDEPGLLERVAQQRHRESAEQMQLLSA